MKVKLFRKPNLNEMNYETLYKYSLCQQRMQGLQKTCFGDGCSNAGADPKVGIMCISNFMYNQ